MLYLADTNILLRLAEPSHPMHAETLKSLAALRASGDVGCIIPQNVIEFCNVATRPAKDNGLGFTHQQTKAEIEKIERLFLLIPDAPEIYAEWKRLVFAHNIIGKQVHDARIAAAMAIHGITRLLTFNKAHFNRFARIVAISPTELTTPAQPPPQQSATPQKSEENDPS